MGYIQETVSIITPSYNANGYIDQMIQSVQSQSWEDWELLIVDDCSTDGTREKLQHYAELDQRIKVFYLSENSGAAIARNRGLQQARGRYVAFLDSDDAWKPDKLIKQLNFMQENAYAFTFTSYELMDQNGVPINKKVTAPQKMTYDDLLKNTIIGCLTVMIDRESIGDIQMPNLKTRQDMVTWLSILKRGFTAYGLDEVLAYYRIGNASISKNKIQAFKTNWYVYRKVEELNMLKAGWCFSHYAFNAIAKRL